jgi:transcriptional regulator with PAS, ATPase and Fis domain
MKGDGDEKLPLITTKAMEKAVLSRQVQEMEYRLDSKSSFAKIIGKSGAINRTIELAKKVAVTDTTVLLLGETGTGKELLAEAIHLASRRRKGPFITINCAAIPKELQESELFGHCKGAFTGAISDKKGYLEVADRGTVFLDELGEMSPELQAKLLRALENRIFNRVGDTEPIPVDIRIIAATNRSLADEENNFRKDLYYRLSTFTIELPALRERPDDIDLLALNFLHENAEKNNKVIKSIEQEFMQLLKAYHWPGNIRELKNVIERAVILADRFELTPDVLPNEILKTNNHQYTENPRTLLTREDSPPSNTVYHSQLPAANLVSDNAVDLKSVEQEHIMRVLSMVNGNKSEAAKRLDIGLATLYRKLKEYNLN